MTPTTFRHPPTERLRQRGMTLIFALVTLAALSLAAVALVRSVSTSSLVVGNLGFKQDSIFYAGQAAEEAVAWLDSNKAGTTLNGANDTEAYYPIAYANMDATNRRPADATRAVVDWEDSNCATPYAAGSFATCLNAKAMTAASTTGNSARFVITRLCNAALSADDPANSCARPIKASASLGCGGVSYQNPTGYCPPGSTVSGPYYKIVTRTVGARNTISYTETIVHF